MNKKLVQVVAALSILTTQSACIIVTLGSDSRRGGYHGGYYDDGYYRGPVYVGGGGYHHHYHGGGGAEVAGAVIAGILAALVVVLDAEAPRPPEIAALPMEQRVATELGVTLDDIEEYNDLRARKVPLVVAKIRADFGSIQSKILAGFGTTEKLNADPEVQEIVARYGFANFGEAETTFAGTSLSSERVSAMARSLGVSVGVLRIILINLGVALD